MDLRNKIYDLYLRHEEDVIAKKPNIVIIYVGINDVWHGDSHEFDAICGDCQIAQTHLCRHILSLFDHAGNRFGLSDDDRSSA